MGCLIDKAPSAQGETPPEAPLRPAATVMRLARLGSFHPTRLSFVRSLVRRHGARGLAIPPAPHDLDASGFGRIVYAIETPAGLLTFCGFSNELRPGGAHRSGHRRGMGRRLRPLRRRASTRPRIARLSHTAPRQEAARYGADELVLAARQPQRPALRQRGAALAAGRQPDLGEVVEVGYLLRTTAVYGNGKFGLADLAGSGATASSRCPTRRRC